MNEENTEIWNLILLAKFGLPGPGAGTGMALAGTSHRHIQIQVAKVLPTQAPSVSLKSPTSRGARSRGPCGVVQRALDEAAWELGLCDYQVRERTPVIFPFWFVNWGRLSVHD